MGAPRDVIGFPALSGLPLAMGDDSLALAMSGAEEARSERAHTAPVEHWVPIPGICLCFVCVLEDTRFRETKGAHPTNGSHSVAAGSWSTFSYMNSRSSNHKAFEALSLWIQIVKTRSQWQRANSFWFDCFTFIFIPERVPKPQKTRIHSLPTVVQGGNMGHARGFSTKSPKSWAR